MIKTKIEVSVLKRSAINAKISSAIEFLNDRKFFLPPFAYFTPDEWKMKKGEYEEARECMLGWDLTDYGSGDFDKIGLLLFTIRNGCHYNPRYKKTYAEKMLLVQEEQYTPLHFHDYKMEDIINRGGGVLLIKLYNSTDTNELADTPVQANLDGRKITVPAGTTLRLMPGESITLPQRLYHTFWGEPGKGRVLVGEVSMTNDDHTDNHFLKPCGRFPQIEEDEAPKYLLVTEL